MALPESERLRTKLDALTWRLREATADLERMRQEASSAQQDLEDTRFATLLGEEDPTELPEKTVRSAAAQAQVANEESLVRRLVQRRAETHADYRQALRRERGSSIRRWLILQEEE